MESVLPKAIQSVEKSKASYCKFISANDAGTTKSHQSGFHIGRSAFNLFFETAGEKGSNKDRNVRIRWQDDFETDSRFIYYGQKTRNEYRLTRFQNNFPYRTDEFVGDLLVITRQSKDDYEAFVISRDEEIEDFLITFNLSPSETNKLIPKLNAPSLDIVFESFIKGLKVEFPAADVMSAEARRIAKILESEVMSDPDRVLLRWIELEYDLFKALENNRYAKTIKQGFKEVKDLIDAANTILNRRKSRAGKALENHLAEIFTINTLQYEQQVITEGKRKPDFIFPGSKEYHNAKFNFEDLFFLGCKTTCKDRWRQIVNEAARIPEKHLFTLQQGISSNQLEEMREEKVTLVVPRDYLGTFSKGYNDVVISLPAFINQVKTRQV